MFWKAIATISVVVALTVVGAFLYVYALISAINYDDEET